MKFTECKFLKSDSCSSNVFLRASYSAPYRKCTHRNYSPLAGVLNFHSSAISGSALFRDQSFLYAFRCYATSPTCTKEMLP